MVQLIRGSIFDSKCDIIIIPCNSLGGISSSIRKGLMSYDFPNTIRHISPGDILFVEPFKNLSNASVIGYAASVDASTSSSSEKIIEEILHCLKNFCQSQSLHKVNIPLLGTGAGGLSEAVSYDLIKKEFENVPDVFLCVYVPSISTYDALSSMKHQNSCESIKNPRVFISYAGMDLHNRAWVKDFAYRLRASGVDARADFFHLKPGQDLPQWMTNELIMADKVLLICDKYYAEKADTRKGGVGWETMIIQGDMLSHQDQGKYIAILRDDDIDNSLPIYVKSKYAFHFSDGSQFDTEFNQLLLYLFDCNLEPALGEIPAFIKENKQQFFSH